MLICHEAYSSSFSFHDFTSVKSHIEIGINTDLMINQFWRKTGGNTAMIDVTAAAVSEPEANE